MHIVDKWNSSKNQNEQSFNSYTGGHIYGHASW